MTLAFSIAAFIASVIVTAVTCVQLLYLESLRISTREHASLEFFKKTLESRLGFETERGSRMFSLIKHVGLAIIGVLTLAATWSATPGWQGLLAAVLLVGFYTAIGTYIIPQTVYRKSSGEGLLVLVPVLRLLAYAISPIMWAIEFVESLFELHVRPEPANGAARAEEHIEALIMAGEEEGIIERGDRELIQSVVAFGDKTVREVMTPRPRVVAIRQDATLDELRQLVINEQYSRIPVYEENIDQIIGFVHVRDVFELDEKQRARKRVRDIMRPIRAVPESKRVNDLLREMQEEGAHMAVVVDEYGQTAGIVTMEDMVEEIVGEIRDEHDKPEVVKEAENTYVVPGSMDVDRLDELFGLRLEEHEATTIGGLVSEIAGHIPQPGEVIEDDKLRFEVLDSTDRKVNRVRVTPAQPSEPQKLAM